MDGSSNLSVSVMTKEITAKEWSTKSEEGILCGMLGCFENYLVECSHCDQYYCEGHIDMHETICSNNWDKERKEEIQQLRSRDQGTIADISQERRQQLREKIWFELQKNFNIKDYNEMYVTGSWYRGDAIYGMSDLDIIIEVHPRDVPNETSNIREYFKNKFSTDRFDNDPWLFLDLWLETGPPNEGEIL